ncbi:MAG: sugar phosphate isomerase/epimerase family protein [Chitinophagales bacterium]
MKYAVSNWIYGDEPLEATFRRLARYGYDGVELRGEPDLYDPREVRRLCEEYRLRVLSLAGMYPWPTEDRDLANPDPAIRERAVAYLCRTADFAVEVGAPLVIVVPSAVGKALPAGPSGDEEAWERSVNREWSLAVDSVRQAARHAGSKGVSLAVEPINRYETFLVNTAEQGLRFIAEVDSPCVGLHLDTFHLNIEEGDPVGAVRRAGEKLINVHIADSNRQAVGCGHFDFRGLIRALKDIGYQGSLALEPLPPLPNPYIALKTKRFIPLWDSYARESIVRLREYERTA